MGTRADFYIGKGKEAKWLGSVAYDGYPDGIDNRVLQSITEDEYRNAVHQFVGGLSHGTLPENGWPWPWKDSHTTDYAYAFEDGKVEATDGDFWFDPLNENEEHKEHGKEDIVFPDMTSRQRVTLGERSGLMVIGVDADGTIKPILEN